MTTYEWGIDLGKRKTKCRGKKCFYDGNIGKGVCRIKKGFENSNNPEFKQQHYFHIDCYLQQTLTQKETTERVTSDTLPDIAGWSGELDDDLRARVVKFFKDWEAGNHKIRWEPDQATKEEQEEEEEEEQGEEEKSGKKRKAKGKEKKPAAKKAKKSEEETLEETKGEESEHTYMENTSDNHNKFYEVWTKGSNLCTRYGAIPSYSTMPVHVKKLTSEEKAKAEMDKTIKQKIAPAKGYSKAERPS